MKLGFDVGFIRDREIVTTSWEREQCGAVRKAVMGEMIVSQRYLLKHK